MKLFTIESFRNEAKRLDPQSSSLLGYNTILYTTLVFFIVGLAYVFGSTLVYRFGPQMTAVQLVIFLIPVIGVVPGTVLFSLVLWRGFQVERIQIALYRRMCTVKFRAQAEAYGILAAVWPGSRENLRALAERARRKLTFIDDLQFSLAA